MAFSANLEKPGDATENYPKDSRPEVSGEIRAGEGREIRTPEGSLKPDRMMDNPMDRMRDLFPEGKFSPVSVPQNAVREAASQGQDAGSGEKADVQEKNEPIQNKREGLEREHTVEQELREQYPETEGYEIQAEVYLRDENGELARDPETGERRRIDFVVIKDGKVVDLVEVTSLTAPKEAQSEKEQRIRDSGGNYMKDKQGNLLEIPETVSTRIERRA